MRSCDLRDKIVVKRGLILRETLTRCSYLVFSSRETLDRRQDIACSQPLACNLLPPRKSIVAVARASQFSFSCLKTPRTEPDPSSIQLHPSKVDLFSETSRSQAEWMAPEFLRGEPTNEKSDVFSFGVILWELLTMQQPWRGLSPVQVVGAVAFQNRRLSIPQDTSPALATLVESCWADDPRQRPSFSSIVETLKKLIKSSTMQVGRS